MKREAQYTSGEAALLKSVGFRIQFFRKVRGLSQEQLAEMSGLSYSTISHIEATSPYPLSLLALYHIATALDIEPYQLLKFD